MSLAYLGLKLQARTRKKEKKIPEAKDFIISSPTYKS
jgi:hypothetical protein